MRGPEIGGQAIDARHLLRVPVVTPPRSRAAIIQRTLTHGGDIMGNGRAGTVEIDILNRRVRVGAVTTHLTGIEQSLLSLLVVNAGKVLTRDDILKAIWGPDAVPPSNVVGRHMCALRAKLHDDSREPCFIATVPGQGYRFVPGDVEGASPPSFVGLPNLPSGSDGLSETDDRSSPRDTDDRVVVSTDD